MVWSLIILFVAIYSIQNGSNSGYIFLSIALFGFFTAINYLLHYRKQKKMINSKINDHADLYCKENSVSVWEFNDDAFRYKDFQYEFRVSWSAFLSLAEPLLLSWSYSSKPH
ncbi:hypothetical protein C3K47_19090 [Solitalea longa]|uniref:Uncharacterized protein n=1 Tax=Solitalea longa TaxID=2079460 RepID=A0A2S4ZWG9_9SPHI|nr:hypothetical protein C3K47_19090 [Solitalea longa]